jgi:hypothetical protein
MEQTLQLSDYIILDCRNTQPKHYLRPQYVHVLSAHLFISLFFFSSQPYTHHRNQTKVPIRRGAVAQMSAKPKPLLLHLRVYCKSDTILCPAEL